MADAGVPDGFVGALAIRALPRVTFHLGAGYAIRPGARAGIQLRLLSSGVTPFVSVEAGRYLSGRVSRAFRDMARSAGLEDAELEQVGYDFASGHAGISFGNSTAAVTLQGGVSVIEATAVVREPTRRTMPRVDLVSETTIRVWTPTGRLGLVMYFY